MRNPPDLDSNCLEGLFDFSFVSEYDDVGLTPSFETNGIQQTPDSPGLNLEELSPFLEIGELDAAGVRRPQCGEPDLGAFERTACN